MLDDTKGDNHMRYALKMTGQGDEDAPKRRTVAPFVAVIAATEVAFVFGLVTHLSWQGCVLAVLVATALAGGAVFTVLEMQRLWSEGR
jgi:hypothetical protein